MNEPHNRYKDRSNDEHDGFFEKTAIVICLLWKSDVFHDEGHNGSCNEDSDGVLDCDGKFTSKSGRVSFKSIDLNEEESQHKFVAEHNAADHRINYNSNFNFKVISIGKSSSVLLFSSLVDQLFSQDILFVEDKVEDETNEEEEANCKDPSQHKPCISFFS